MAEGSANKVKISDRDKKIIYIFAGVAILLLAYFLGFQKMMESRSALVEENITLEDEVKKLTAMVAEKASVEKATEDFKRKTEETLAKYPLEIKTQDVIYQLDLLEQDVSGLLLEAEAFTMNQVFFANGALTDGTVQDVAAQPEASAAAASTAITGYRSSVTTNFTTNYDSLKKVVDFINNNANRMTITNITISQAEGVKELACNLNVDMYAVAGTEKVYNSPEINGVNIGKNALFSEGK